MTDDTALEEFWRKAKDAARRADLAQKPQGRPKQASISRTDILQATPPLGPEASKVTVVDRRAGQPD